MSQNLLQNPNNLTTFAPRKLQPNSILNPYTHNRLIERVLKKGSTDLPRSVYDNDSNRFTYKESGRSEHGPILDDANSEAIGDVIADEKGGLSVEFTK